MHREVVSIVRSAALGSGCLSLAKTCSIGSRSGLQGGRNTRCAPVARIAARTAFRLWLPGLSMTATSPGMSVGTRNWRTQARKMVAADRPVDDARRVDAVVVQRGDEGHRRPAAERHLRPKPPAARSPARSGPMLVLARVSSRKTSRRGSTLACRAFQRTRLRATSGRSCSLASTVF